jgi:hypothetical protein
MGSVNFPAMKQSHIRGWSPKGESTIPHQIFFRGKT